MGKIAFELSKPFFQYPNITVLRTLEMNLEILERWKRLQSDTGHLMANLDC